MGRMNLTSTSTDIQECHCFNHICVLPFCGDGVLDTGEGCDDGEFNADIEPETLLKGLE